MEAPVERKGTSVGASQYRSDLSLILDRARSAGLVIHLRLCLSPLGSVLPFRNVKHLLVPSRWRSTSSLLFVSLR